MTARALTIAGSDPTGGAGIQQDLKVFAAFGVWGLSAVTALTVQDTSGVARWEGVAPELVREQIEAVVTDLGCDAVKTGMLGRSDNVGAVARALDELAIERVVVDPVMRSGAGDDLGDPDLVSVLREGLLPRATLVTPNVPEAATLAGIEIRDLDEQKESAVAIAALGPSNVLVTGGHLEGPAVVDVLFADEEIYELKADRLDVGPVHGTGCALSAAITASLAKGLTVIEAVHIAHRAVHDAIARALVVGRGAKVLGIPMESRPIE